MGSIAMLQDADLIHNYLPLEQGAESDYINHLWETYQILISSSDIVKPFAIMPFHLLFMFAVQYKVFRISAFFPSEYIAVLNQCGIRKPEHLRVLKSNPPVKDKLGIVSRESSVRNLSFVPEKRLFDFFKIIDIGSDVLQKVSEIIEIRSSYAHANGNIEENIEERIDTYLVMLDSIQANMIRLNDLLAQEWVSEIEISDDLEQFVGLRLYQNNLCSADFESGLLADKFSIIIN